MWRMQPASRREGFSSALVPDLPTVEEQGIPEQRSFVKKGIFDGAGHADRLARP
ncbi:MAG TPA: hypothetical protein VGV41_13425 [Pseudolabrys sp.]|uniref:hypothetical protein n=1 Tax=Pseudolabrys sp. TaxID=1960880 RepID=UPI002DDD3CE4|nr:hypothetical protein [Pseudolabrys sp.]HEV2629631.1 hypothetical protein [Pseudolabrys sp.]